MNVDCMTLEVVKANLDTYSYRMQKAAEIADVVFIMHSDFSMPLLLVQKLCTTSQAVYSQSQWSRRSAGGQT